jgi:hypothetical protein
LGAVAGQQAGRQEREADGDSASAAQPAAQARRQTEKAIRRKGLFAGENRVHKSREAAHVSERSSLERTLIVHLRLAYEGSRKIF